MNDNMKTADLITGSAIQCSRCGHSRVIDPRWRQQALAKIRSFRDKLGTIQLRCSMCAATNPTIHKSPFRNEAVDIASDNVDDMLNRAPDPFGRPPSSGRSSDEFEDEFEYEDSAMDEVFSTARVDEDFGYIDPDRDGSPYSADEIAASDNGGWMYDDED